MAATKPRYQIELIGGPMDGAVYMCKKLMEVLELGDLITLDPASDTPYSDDLHFYHKEKFVSGQWLYLYTGHDPE